MPLVVLKSHSLFRSCGTTDFDVRVQVMARFDGILGAFHPPDIVASLKQEKRILYVFSWAGAVYNCPLFFNLQRFSPSLLEKDQVSSMLHELTHLGRMAEVWGGEVAGMRRAIDETSPEWEILISFDSQAAIAVVRKAGRTGKARDLRCLLKTIKKRQRDLGPDAVQLGWVKAHIGIEGNEAVML